jgi:hypothetical protein
MLCGCGRGAQSQCRCGRGEPSPGADVDTRAASARYKAYVEFVAVDDAQDKDDIAEDCIEHLRATSARLLALGRQ